jgi:hypothetical protein
LIPSTVQYIGKNNKGKHSLSRKAVLESKLGVSRKPNEGGGVKISAPKDPPSQEMSKDEVDVIAKAIEGVTEL